MDDCLHTLRRGWFKLRQTTIAATLPPLQAAGLMRLQRPADGNLAVARAVNRFFRAVYHRLEAVVNLVSA